MSLKYPLVHIDEVKPARITDPAKVEAYRKLAAPVIQASGAKFLVRGDGAVRDLRIVEGL